MHKSGSTSRQDTLDKPSPSGDCFYHGAFCEKPMPTYHVEMMEGRTVEQKKKLVAEITRVSVEILGGSPDSVDIIITDIKRENWSTGGKLWSEPRD